MTDWTISQRKSFLTDLLALPPKEIAQVQKKLTQLVEDPLPDAKVKKQLKNWKGGTLYRLRCGDYRLFYTLEENFISLLALRRRSEATYDEEIDPIVYGGPKGEGETTVERRTGDDRFWDTFAREQERAAEHPLPEPLTVEFLEQLLIPRELHDGLLEVRTEEELLASPGVDDELLLRIHEAVFEKPLSEVLRQPEFVAESVEDLFRYKSGDLPGFLLRLSPGQEALVAFNLQGSKPTLVKGGPGSGKSTVALYRAAAIVRNSTREGASVPRVLFTTYTNALTNVSNALIRTLLPESPSAVVVKTADSLVKEIIEGAGIRFAPANEVQMRDALRSALEKTSLGSNALERQKNKDAIGRFSENYLMEEICSVVIAQNLPDLKSYVENPRVGRQQPLASNERELIWNLSRQFVSELARYRLETWSELRAKAAKLVTSGAAKLDFDAVIVDEVQDLEPTVVALLIGLAKTPASLFLTADSRQSIYRSGFVWDEVLAALKIDVEVSELPGNYRSTEQIDRAAKNYFGEGSALSFAERYAHDGPLPIVFGVTNEDLEARLIAQYIVGATKMLGLTRSSCVVLVPTQNQGRRIVGKLTQLGIEAEFSLGRQLDITSEGVKILPFQSAKGLEFPIVVIAGLWPSDYPYVPKGASAAEKSELQSIQRRTMFVAMTRAMRALMLVKPTVQVATLLQPFDPDLWNLKA